MMLSNFHNYNKLHQCITEELYEVKAILNDVSITDYLNQEEYDKLEREHKMLQWLLEMHKFTR